MTTGKLNSPFTDRQFKEIVGSIWEIERQKKA